MDTYYAAMKRNELLIYRTTWLNLRNMLSKNKPGIKEYTLYNSTQMKF